jgi:Tropinone reductase 1
VGTSIYKPTLEVTAQDFSFIMTTNFESAYHLSQLAHPLLKGSGAGNIVFLSSMAGLLSFGGLSVYGASKGNIYTLCNFIFFHTLWIVNLRIMCVNFHVLCRSNKPTY